MNQNQLAAPFSTTSQSPVNEGFVFVSNDGRVLPLNSCGGGKAFSVNQNDNAILQGEVCYKWSSGQISRLVPKTSQVNGVNTLSSSGLGSPSPYNPFSTQSNGAATPQGVGGSVCVNFSNGQIVPLVPASSDASLQGLGGEVCVRFGNEHIVPLIVPGATPQSTGGTLRGFPFSMGGDTGTNYTFSNRSGALSPITSGNGSATPQGWGGEVCIKFSNGQIVPLVPASSDASLQGLGGEVCVRFGNEHIVPLIVPGATPQSTGGTLRGFPFSMGGGGMIGTRFSNQGGGISMAGDTGANLTFSNQAGSISPFSTQGNGAATPQGWGGSACVKFSNGRIVPLVPASSDASLQGLGGELCWRFETGDLMPLVAPGATPQSAGGTLRGFPFNMGGSIGISYTFSTPGSNSATPQGEVCVKLSNGEIVPLIPESPQDGGSVTTLSGSTGLGISSSAGLMSSGRVGYKLGGNTASTPGVGTYSAVGAVAPMGEVCVRLSNGIVQPLCA